MIDPKSEPASAAEAAAANAAPDAPAVDAAPETETTGADHAAQIEALKAEAADYKDKMLRAYADLENLRRRAERDREDIQKFAIAKFAKDLLSVADNLRRALDAAPKAPDEALKPFVAGIEATERELQGVFERHQVRPIEALGARFDANLHEAVFEIEDPSKPAGTVAQVMATGYTLAGRLLRAAMVAVAKGGPKEQPARVDTQV